MTSKQVRKAYPPLALANSIEIKVPDKVLKPDKKDNIYKIVSVGDKKGNRIRKGTIVVKPDKSTRKPVISKEGLYRPSDPKSRYKMSVELQKQAGKYDPNIKELPEKKPRKARETKKETKKDIIDKIKSLNPSMKSLQIKKKADLMKILSELQAGGGAGDMEEEMTGSSGMNTKTSVKRVRKTKIGKMTGLKRKSVVRK